MIKKGCGYEFVEKDLIIFYVVLKFDYISGVLFKSSGGFFFYLKIFGDWLCEMVVKDNKLMVIMLVMCEGLGMVEFLKKFFDWYFDVVIVEQYVVIFVVGLVIGDYKLVVVIYFIFLQ